MLDFDSQVNAYVDAGLLGLDFLDKTRILVTPDAKDLFSDLGMAQAQAVMELQAKYYINNPGTAAYHSALHPFQWGTITRIVEEKAVKELLTPLYKFGP